MCWLYLVQDVSDAPVPSDLSSTLVIQDDNAFFHVMSNNTSNYYLMHVQYLTAYQGVATLSLAQKARLSKWRDRCLVPVMH